MAPIAAGECRRYPARKAMLPYRATNKDGRALPERQLDQQGTAKEATVLSLFNRGRCPTAVNAVHDGGQQPPEFLISAARARSA